MTRFINGFSINGATSQSWVVRAAAVAVCVVISVSATTSRVIAAAATANASVTVSLSQTLTIRDGASGNAGATAIANPEIRYAGGAFGAAQATGNAAVLRSIFSSAGGDATSYGEALTAQALGESSSGVTASVVQVIAHIVFPGRGLTQATATGESAADVTRYPRALAGYGEINYTRAEAAVMRNGTSFYEHDAFALNATANATGEVPQDRIKIIATLGSFDFGDSTGASVAFINHPGRVLGSCINSGTSVVAIHIHHSDVTANGTAGAAVEGVRNLLASASVVAESESYAPKAQINFSGGSSAIAESTSFGVESSRFATRMVSATASASVVSAIEYGTQHRAETTNESACEATALANQLHAGTVNSLAAYEAVQVIATLQKAATVNAVMATALVGRAFAITNSEIKAPDDRYMMVSAEERGMTVYAEERTMVVTA